MQCDKIMILNFWGCPKPEQAGQLEKSGTPKQRRLRKLLWWATKTKGEFVRKSSELTHRTLGSLMVDVKSGPSKNESGRKKRTDKIEPPQTQPKREATTTETPEPLHYRKSAGKNSHFQPGARSIKPNYNVLSTARQPYRPYSFE